MKNKKTTLMRKADRLWYLTYLKTACEICGNERVLQGHHFFYRSSYGHLRYVKENHITLCSKCHFILHHQDPKMITDQIIAKRGKYWYNRLRNKALTKPKPSYQTIVYYENIIKDLSNLSQSL